jgi:hypothetical protein
MNATNFKSTRLFRSVTITTEFATFVSDGSQITSTMLDGQQTAEKSLVICITNIQRLHYSALVQA